MVEEHVLDGERRIVLDNCILIDSYLHCRPMQYYAQFRGKNAWLFHLSDETYEGGYEAYSNFRGVFRNYWSDIFDSRRVMQLPLGYTAGLNRQGAKPKARDRRYLWSFMGQARKGSRPDMIRALLPIDPKLTHITDSVSRAEPLGRSAYEQVLRDSAFVPSPMGNVNLDCFRIYEALELGAIPILERRATLDYFAGLLGHHPLPVFGNWNEAAAFLKGMRDDPSRMDDLQARCVEWWSGYKEGLRNRIQEFISGKPGQDSGKWVSRRYSLPGWQAAELLRHHSFPAVRRRVALQIRRLTTQGRLRKTMGA